MIDTPAPTPPPEPARPTTTHDRGPASVHAVSSLDVDAGHIPLDDEIAIHACASCGVELEDRYHLDCPSCGALGCPVSRCRGCAGLLERRMFRFTSVEPSGARVVKGLCGVRCAACGLQGIEGHELDTLAELAARPELADVAGPLEILPEAGYFTPERLEVLADADVGGPGEREYVEKHHGGLMLRVGSPSALFEAALAAVTDHDPADIFSPTLSLTPGPPYDKAQRASFHRLLAEVQSELGSAVTCWSASVGLSEEPLVDAVLVRQLCESSAEGDGMTLALYNAILAGHAPGRLLNGVRLLEHVLGEPEPGRFADALRAAVEQRGKRSLPVLEQLWRAMYPGLAFDEAHVYAAMQALHQRQARPQADERGAPLPWEQPDHEGYAAWLRRLVSELL